MRGDRYRLQKLLWESGKCVGREKLSSERTGVLVQGASSRAVGDAHSVAKLEAA